MDLNGIIIMKINFKINLTKKQKEAYSIIHRDDIQYLVCRWSRQCGKSVFAEILMIEYLCKPNTFNAYISPTFALGRKVYKELMTLLNESGIIKSANGSTLTIESIYGSTLQFFSIEAYTAIRGNTVSGILIMDECAFYPDSLPSGEDPWGSVIMPITKARKPKVLIISTPRGKRGMFYSFYNKALSNENGYAEITATIFDDELITKEQIEEIRKSIPKHSFEEEFEVKFLDSSITFFSGFEKCFTDYQYDRSCKTWIGIDLSSIGTDETIISIINEYNQIEIIPIEGTLDEKYKKISNIINSIKSLQAVYVEENGLGSPIINEIRKLINNKTIIHNWLTTNNSKEEIISEMAVKIANGEIKFNNKDTKLYSQLGTFIVKYSKTNKLQFEAQSGHHDDYVMATAIAIKCKDNFKYSNNVSFARRNALKKLI